MEESCNMAHVSKPTQKVFFSSNWRTKERLENGSDNTVQQATETNAKLGKNFNLQPELRE